MKPTGPDNPETITLIKHLKKEAIEKKAKIWKAVATELERPRRIKRVVNIGEINKHCKDNETIVVPGKVLASGELEKKITIAAFSFSQEALAKINMKGKAISIQELMKQNPKGSRVRIIG